MTKPEWTIPVQAKAGARLVEPPREAVNVRCRPLKMTAIMKRRALRKKPDKPEVAVLSAAE
jgi:hypothetical protein